jgi:NDP-sugar pyrophosphorylase family protein
MQIVIPMSGFGNRFRAKGYSLPKPLIKVEGRPIIEHVVRNFPGELDFLFICNREHLETTPMRATLERIAPTGTIVAIEPHKLGPVHAALQAADWIRDASPVILNYCDFSWTWDYAAFRRFTEATRCDGAIAAYRGFHPHSLGPNLYAYMRTAGRRVLEIQEKGCFTSNRMQEYASSGTYYFRTGALMKHAFRRSVVENLVLNGEYYASLPYNLLIHDGRDVQVYELDQFLQWGTPEDLEEYVQWSDYFHHAENWRPALAQSPGAILLPMAGEGVRFQREGYSTPKPFIPVAGVPMVDRSLGSLPPAARVLTVGRLEVPGTETLRITGTTAGQASTCLLAKDRLDPAQPVLIAPCDAAMVYDESAWRALTTDPTVDCLVWAFRNHPHANRHPQQYGWIQTNAAGAIERVSCKAALSDTPERDLGVIGAFWFRQARFLWDAIEEMIRREIRVNGEFYVDTAINVLLEQGRRARAFPVRHYLCFGTPDDVRTYEYWHRYFHRPQGPQETPHAAVDRVALL